MDKPTKPTNLLPRSFGGEKTDWTPNFRQVGYEADVPAMLRGDNLNYLLDTIGPELEYTEKIADFVNGLPINNVITTDENNKLVYKNINEVGGGGLELCDIGMSLYIDETKGLRRRLNGQVVAINANTQAFLNRLKQIVALYPSLSVTESAWQAAKTASDYGQVGRFVIDEEAGTVRLPAVVNVQGALDLQNLGLTVEAGLPNIEAYVDTTAQMGGETGAFSVGSANQYFTGAVGQGSDTLTFDASESNPIYGNSDTVQPEAVQYPYFIQIATGQETENNIVNELELCNPFVLLEPKYSESLLYNESWLRSNGQWNAKTLYVSVYEALQVEYNSEIDAGSTVTLPSGGAYTKRGLPVKLSTEEYTDYDHVLNTSEETFRLALKTNLSDDSVSGLYLYFYAGAVSQNAGIVNAGRVEEALVDKLNSDHSNDTKPYVVETYHNGRSWYRIWSDGWMEQGGYYITEASGGGTVTLIKPYSSTDYAISVTGLHALETLSQWHTKACQPITKNSFNIISNQAATLGSFWETSGY